MIAPGGAALLPFLFDGSVLIRVIDRASAPWFVARDVAEALGYADPAKAVSTHCKRAEAIGEGEGGSPPPGGRNAHPLLDPQTKLIPESDVFRLILRSRLPAAQRVETWVMEELLPAIRKPAQVAPVFAIEPNREADALDYVRLRAISECRKVFGERAAGQLWFKLGMPCGPAMALADGRQGELLTHG